MIRWQFLFERCNLQAKQRPATSLLILREKRKKFALTCYRMTDYTLQVRSQKYQSSHIWRSLQKTHYTGPFRIYAVLWGTFIFSEVSSRLLLGQNTVINIFFVAFLKVATGRLEMCFHWDHNITVVFCFFLALTTTKTLLKTNNKQYESLYIKTHHTTII